MSPGVWLLLHQRLLRLLLLRLLLHLTFASALEPAAFAIAIPRSYGLRRIRARSGPLRLQQWHGSRDPIPHRDPWRNPWRLARHLRCCGHERL